MSMLRPAIILLAALIALPAAAPAAVVVFDVTVPSTTPADATVYLAGDFQGWSPGAADWALARGAAGHWSCRATFAAGQPLQFKFTLGGWERVEKGAVGEELQNRLHVVRGDTTLQLAVAAWADGAPPRDTTTGDVRLMDVPGFADGRRVWIWLPPGYDAEPARRYPVLYVLDGQNAFNAASSFAGEWEIDESAHRLVAAGEVEPLIIVAVANGEGRRALEYTPWPAPDWREPTGGGGDHLREICEVLKPAVDRQWRTLTGPEHTGLCGSSFGGLMALYAGWVRPDVFGRLAALSPSLGWAGHAPLAMVSARPRPPVRLYVDMGTREEGNLHDADGNGRDDAVDDLEALAAALRQRGFVDGRDLQVVVDEGARHHESFWARRFPGALRFLFPEN
jgi:predicted alpha/beta superfamily hydrolase